MPYRSIYFHASRREVATLAKRWIAQLETKAVAVDSGRRALRPLDPSHVDNEIIDDKVRCIILARDVSEKFFDHYNLFLEHHAGAIVVWIGDRGERGLRSSSMSAAASSAEELKWSGPAFRELKAFAPAGGWIVSFDWGSARGISRNQRFSPDAIELAKGGVKLVTEADSAYYIPRALEGYM